MLAENIVLVDWLKGDVAKLTLSDPPLNLITLEVPQRLIEALENLRRDESVCAIVVTGAGDKAFCADSDIKEFADVRDRVVERKMSRENRAFGAFEALSKLVIAAIECGVRGSAQLTREESVQLTLELSDRVLKIGDSAERSKASFGRREPRFERAPGHQGRELEAASLVS